MCVLARQALSLRDGGWRAVLGLVFGKGLARARVREWRGVLAVLFGAMDILGVAGEPEAVGLVVVLEQALDL